MSEKPVLYHYPLSPNAVKVLSVLHHLGLDYDEVIVDLPRGGSHTPEFLALNPNGKIPVLKEGDFILPESNAIIRYLAEKTGSDLIPADLRQRALMDSWLHWQGAHWTPAYGHMTFERLAPRLIPGYAVDEAAQARAQALIDRFAPVLDRHLEGRRWVLGEQLSLADFSLASTLVHRALAGISLEAYPNIAAWVQRVEELPAYRRAMPQMPTPA
ncbi:MAG TPA: glutathione S-transferase family protein [Candidatus Nitrosotenuis sp.]|jgi:glutathione S-transferase|nr:glutathione S-transferase family protein [Candidatus Nitrosotenuis sp.]